MHAHLSEVLDSSVRVLLKPWALQELSDRGQAISLNIPQLVSLRDCLAALHWATRARALLASTEPDPRPVPAQLGDVKEQRALAESSAVQSGAPVEPQPVADGGHLSSSAPAQEAARAPLQLRLVRAIVLL